MQLFHPLGFFSSPSLSSRKFRRRELSHFPRIVSELSRVWIPIPRDLDGQIWTAVRNRNICSINTSSPSWVGRSWSRRYSNCRNSCSWTWSSRRICCKRRTRRRRPPRFSNWRFNSNVWYSNCRSRRANTFFNRVWVFRVTILLRVSAESVLNPLRISSCPLCFLKNYPFLISRYIHNNWRQRLQRAKQLQLSKVSRSWPSRFKR